MTASNMLTTFAIALGGAAGTVMRYWVGLALARWSQALPWGTIVINVTGSFAIALFGALTVSGARFQAPETARLVFMVGLCGGYTTFSSFSLQTLDLLRNGAPLRALMNVGLSVGLCMASVTVGYLAAQTINHRYAAHVPLSASDK